MNDVQIDLNSQEGKLNSNHNQNHNQYSKPDSTLLAYIDSIKNQDKNKNTNDNNSTEHLKTNMADVSEFN
jgi:hypothetical protein